MRLGRGLAALALLLGSVSRVSPASAQSARDPQAKTPSLLGELGLPAAERLLSSESSRDRMRGLARLSALGTPRAVELLARALDPGGAARGAEEHLAAVRALSPHAKQPLARDALVRALSSPPVESDAGPLSEWAQSAAALALAKTQDAAALSALGRALRKPGRAAELTKDALLAYPPQDLSLILRVPGAPTRELCQTLGELGDLRADSFLRDVVRRGGPEARAAAALALLSLGSTEVVELSRHWLRSERQPVLVAAAAEILSRSRADDAPAILSELGKADATADLALELWLQSDGRSPPPLPLGALRGSPRLPGVLELLARGGPNNLAALEPTLANADTSSLAVYALSRAPGAAALARLERALGEPRLRALALRALALRKERLGETSKGLVDALRSAARSHDENERAAAAFAIGIVTPDELPGLLASQDPVVVRAAARLAGTGAAARAAVMRLQHEREPALRAALGIGLADASAAELVPTPLLLELVHEAGPASYLAAMALSARKDDDLLPLLRELLGSGDPWLRAHTLLGLARASEPDALGLIENAYRFEPDASVRHAAVVALSHRPEQVKRRTLELAATLDSSQLVRDAARLALSGHALGQSAHGPEQAFLELQKTPGLEPGLVPAALVRVGTGPALPAVADPDGVVVLVGIDPAPLEVRLALLSERVNLPEPSR